VTWGWQLNVTNMYTTQKEFKRLSTKIPVAFGMLKSDYSS